MLVQADCVCNAGNSMTVPALPEGLGAAYGGALTLCTSNGVDCSSSRGYGIKVALTRGS